MRSPASDPVERMEGVGEKTAEILTANGIQTVQDVLKSNVESLSALPGIGDEKGGKTDSVGPDVFGERGRA